MSIHSQEVLVTSKEVSKKLYMNLKVKGKRADLVGGLYFKNDRFLFCWREPNFEYFCSFYLSMKGDGTLSSFQEDSDYGQGSLVDYIENKRVSGVGWIYEHDLGMDLIVEGDLAQRLIEKMPESKVQNNQLVGKDIICAERSEEDLPAQCLVRVEYLKEKSEEVENIKGLF